MSSILSTPKDTTDSIIKKLFTQFRFNFEYLGLIESDSLSPYNFLLESHRAGMKNLDGSEIVILEDGGDPFGLDRICHLNGLFAFGHPLKPYTFKDDGYEALNHITHESFPLMYGIFLFDLIHRNEAAPLIFPTDYNFYEESLARQFLTNKKYEKGYILPVFHPLHREVFTRKHFKAMNYNPTSLELKYNVLDYPEKLKESIIIINFALTLLFNIILIESAFVDLAGYGQMKRKLDLSKEIGKSDVDQEKLTLLAFLLSCLHPFVYAVTYGIFRNRYAMRNDLALKAPHGSFYFGTDEERSPFKEVLQMAIKKVINYKYHNKSLASQEKEALLWLSDVFGIGYSTNLVMGDANKHFWEKVDYTPQDLQDETFVSGASEDSPLWRMWYLWAGAYWTRSDLSKICKNNPAVLERQFDKKINRKASKLRFDFIYTSSKLAKNFLLQKVNDRHLSEMKRKLLRKKLKEIWNLE